MGQNNFSLEGVKPTSENDAVLIGASGTLANDITTKRNLMKEVSIHAQFTDVAKRASFDSIADRKLGDVITQDASENILAAQNLTLREVFNPIITIELPKVMPDHFSFFKNPIDFFTEINPIHVLPGYKKLDEICKNKNASIYGKNIVENNVKKSIVRIDVSDWHSSWATP